MSGVRQLLATRNARVYLIGQTLSLFGDTALWLAMAIWVKSLTGSSADAGLVFFFFTAPTLLSPASGLLVDRVRRRPLLIATNLVTGGAVLLLLLVHGRGDVWLIYLVMSLYGLAYTVLGSGQSALLTVMLPADLLPDANGALQTVRELLRLVSPLAGAGLYTLVGGGAVAVVDAATFLAATLALLLLRLEEPAPHPAEGHWRAEVSAGVRHVLRTVPLRQMVLAGAAALLVFGFAETLIFAVVSQGLHRSPPFVGVLVALQGVGAVVGAPTAAPLVRRIGESWLIGAGLFLSAIGSLLLIPAVAASVYVGVILFGASLPWIIVGAVSLLQRLTPAPLQGRAYAALDLLVTTPQTVSIALGAALLGVAGYRLLFVVMAAVLALSATYLLTRADQRATPPWRRRTVEAGPVPDLPLPVDAPPSR